MMDKNVMDTNERVFTTDRLNLAAFLHASNRLRFLECQLSPKAGYPGHITFVFDDPNGRGELFETEYFKGAPVPANIMVGSLKYLRTRMTLLQRGVEANGNR